MRKLKLKKKLKKKKHNHLVVRVLIFLSLLVAASCLVIGLSGTANKPAAQTLQVQPSASPVSPPTQSQVSPPTQTENNTLPDPEQPVKNFGVPTQYRGKIFKNVKLSDQEKVVALTFDDGPWRYTPQVLEILKENDIKATFFCIGRMVKRYPEIAKEVVAEGHVIANHTWSHSYRWMNKAAAAWEIDDTADLIYKTTGVKSLYFRPPGGILTNGVADYAKKKNYAVVMWSNDAIDYRPYSPQRLVNNVMRNIKPVDIVLMHDGGGNRSATVKALPQIIARLKKLGYKFVTIPELLEIEIKEQEEASSTKTKKVESKQENLLPSSITPNPEASPGDRMQELPHSLTPSPASPLPTEQY